MKQLASYKLLGYVILFGCIVKEKTIFSSKYNTLAGQYSN